MIGDVPSKPRVYLETTIPSYLTSRPSRDLVVAAHQQITSDWWADHRHRFELFTSGRVLREARQGDPQAATRRLELMNGIPLLGATAQVSELAERFLKIGRMPNRASEDALHIAIAAVHGMDYLLTWNCRHIANGEIVRRLAQISAAAGLLLPTLCTPDQLMGE